jgi:hypothetical protein
MQVYNIGKANNTEPQMRNSYHQTFVIRDHKIFGLAKNVVINGKLFSWKELLEEIKGRSNWTNTLRLSLDMFLGTLKGFADISEVKATREAGIRAFMKDFIRRGLVQYFGKDKVDSAKNAKANTIQVQVTIEYCIEIQIYEYLFSDLLTLFMESSREELFLNSLEPYILASKFRSVQVSCELVNKLINFYAKQGKLEVLEKILLFLRLDGQDLNNLNSVCAVHKLFSALIYIKTLQENDFEYIEPTRIMLSELADREKDKKEFNLQTLVDNMKYNKEFENSYTYIGYKILWYIRLCFKGEKFPPRIEDSDKRIPYTNWPKIIYALLNWMFAIQNNVTNLQILMQYDVKSVFNVLSLLFENPDLRSFITEPQKFKIPEKSSFNYLEILKRVTIIADNIESKKTKSKHYNTLFLAKVAALPGVAILAEHCIKTAKYLLSCTRDTANLMKDIGNSEQGRSTNAKLMLQMIRNCSELTNQHIDELILETEKSPYAEVLVHLTEMKGDYLKCFEIFLAQEDAKRGVGIFPWLKSVREKTTDANQHFAAIQKLIYENLEKLVK